MPTRLNVLFHGLFVFVDLRTWIEVLIPNMGNDHVYRAGEWLGETTLQRIRDPYVLSGVSRGAGVFDPDNNLIVRGMQPIADNRGIYARIRLPRPNNITSLRQITLEPDCLMENPAGTVTSRTVSTEHVFTYDIEGNNEQNVRLGNHPLTRSIQQFNGNDYMNLHVIAEPDQPILHPHHVMNGFRRAVSLIPNLQGKLELMCSPVIPPLTNQDPLPPGCILPEFLDLRQRVERLAFYGRDIRQALLANPQAPVPPWAGLVGVGDTLRNCLGFITDL